MQASQSQSDRTQEQLPDLRIVPLASLMPHEENDTQRSEPLIERIRTAGTLLNPPIVAPMDDDPINGHFVILDGANRHYALRELGYAYILVQVADYESDAVQLETWNHVVSGPSWFEFLRPINAILGLKLTATDLLSAQAALAQRDIMAYAVLEDGCAYTMHATATTLAEHNKILRKIVNTYKRNGVLNRIRTDVLRQARKLYPDALAIVVFPHYQPAEIVVAARDGAYLPPGISRHIIRGRAMRLHYPLEAFRENGESLAQKNEQLQLWIQRRMAEKRIRFYAESTFIFDE
ncbi:MAG: ParB N-terminal domain-containing protein [Chloroflexota bacterium]